MTTIQINDNYRIVVEQDEDAQCPRGDWSMITGFVKVADGDSRRSDVPAVYSDPINITQADRDFNNRIAFVGKGVTEEVVARWARIFHGLVVEYDSTHGGYWFCTLDGDDSSIKANWPELECGTPEHLAMQATVITQEQATYETWASGAVYGVIVEKKETYSKDSDPSVVIEKWEQVDALWGCYLDDEYTAQDVAKEMVGDLAELK